MTDLSLEIALEKIKSVFDLDALLAQHYDYQSFPLPPRRSTLEKSNSPKTNADLNLRKLLYKYYQQSEIGYRKYHSQAGSIHLAINDNDRFDPSGYYTQPQAIAQEIQSLQAQQVLEVGFGKGFNSKFLANSFPSVSFLGLDLVPLHVRIASREAQSYPNLRYQLGDFNQTNLASGCMDLVYGIECLCYATEITTLLTELHRVLRPGGRLVIFDAYRRLGFEQQPRDLQVASQLVELGMVLPIGFRSVETWLETAQQVGFESKVLDDRTRGVLPNLRHLQALAQRFFKHSWRAKLLKLWFPPYLIRNAIPGLLLPFTCDLDLGTHCYCHLVLEKRE